MYLKPGLLFLWHQVREKSLSLPINTLKLNKQIADIYAVAKKPRGTIVFIHGMSLLGNKDPRQIKVCSSLAKAGFIVIAPDFKEIRQTQITEKSQENLVRLSQAILEKKELCPTGKISFFAPSFSAAIAIRASAHKALQKKVGAICSVGTFAHVDHVIRFVLQNENSDDYARLIILKNFIELAIGKNPTVKKALELKIEDNWHRRAVEEQKFPKFLLKLTKKEQNKIKDLVENRKVAQKYFHTFLPKIEDLSRKINPYLVLDNLSCAVLLLHGKNDNVIPSHESLFLYQELKKRNIPAKLLVTSYISHGDNKISFAKLKELISVIKAFSWYFGYA